MSPLIQVSIPDAFIIFFLTLRPLKAIGPFAQVTRGGQPRPASHPAWWSFMIATVIVLTAALVGAVVLRQRPVSVSTLMSRR
jgi:small neutral amino acid transporter SnatA (MarC family)